MGQSKQRKNPPCIKMVRKRLANGKVVVYRYHRVTNLRIKGEPGTREFYENWLIASRKERVQHPVQTFKDILEAYETAPEYRRLRPATRREYYRYMKKITHEYGSMPLGALNDPKVRGVFLNWRDSMASHPKTADYAIAVLSRVLNWAKDRGEINHNHVAGAGRLYKARRAAKIWTPEDIKKFCAVVPKVHGYAVCLAASTGLARGDLVRLTWAQIGESAISGERHKTNEAFTIPILSETRALLDEIDCKCPQVLTNSYGRPWRADALTQAVIRGAAKAGIKDRTMHDLRGTFATRLLARGLSHGQIARIMGWSEETVESLSRVYIDGPTVSAEVINLLEREPNMI